MLREVHHEVSVLTWMSTKDAQRKPPQNYPERMPLKAEEIKAYLDSQPPVPDVLPVDEMNDWLGWAKRPTG